MRNVLFSNNFAIMTAENPMHPVAVQGGNAVLEKELASKKLKFHKIKGKYGGNSENSYLIENPNHDVIIDLGKKFGQDSVIVSKNGHHKMVYTNGPDTGKHHLGNSIETFDKEPQDYFSTGMDKGKPFHFSINFDMDTKHHDSLNKSESKYLVHFSNTSGLTELDPMMQGSAGRHSPETKHGRPEHPRTYFYEEGTPTESVVTSGAKSKYLIKHPDYDKIYDMGKDPHGLIPQVQQAWRERPRGSLNDMFFKLLKDKGFLGFKNSASALPNVVGMFYKTPVHAEIPMPTDWSEIKNWTEALVPMSLKKSENSPTHKAYLNAINQRYQEKLNHHKKLEQQGISKKDEPHINMLKQHDAEEHAQQVNFLNDIANSGHTDTLHSFLTEAYDARQADHLKILKKFGKDFSDIVAQHGNTLIQPSDYVPINAAWWRFFHHANNHLKEAASVPEELKNSQDNMSTKQTVKKIKGLAKLNEVMKETPANMRSKVLSALRKEKLAKMNSMGVSGAGGATPPMMQPPVPAAPAMSGLAKADTKMIKVKGKTIKTGKPVEVDAIETKNSIKIPSDSWRKLNLPHDDYPIWEHNEAAGHTKFFAQKNGSFISHKTQQDLHENMVQQAKQFNPSKKLDRSDSGLAKADESESKMAKKDLKDILEYAQALDGMVVESEDLEDWVDSKIAVARQYLSDIAHYLSYEHGQPTEELDKGDVIGMKDKKVISTDTQPASKELVAAQPKAAKNARALAQRLKSNWEGPKPSLAKADASHVKNTIESKTNPKLKQNPNQDAKKILDSKPDFSSAYKKHPHLSTIQIDKIVEKDPAAAAKYLSKSDSKKAKFERCVMAVKKKSGKKVNPWAVCHASVDGKMEKADMSVKEQEKPTKGMPQAKQLKADADLEKIKEGAESVLETADKKKDNLSKSSEELEKAKAKPPVGTPERKEFDTLVQQVKGRDKGKAEVAAKELKSKYDYHENEILRLKKPTQKQKEIAKKIKERRAKAVYGSNYKRQRDAVFGKWGTSNKEKKDKQMRALENYGEKKFNATVEQVKYNPKEGHGKKNKQGKLINKPSFGIRDSKPVIQHIGNTDSLSHEYGHAHQFGLDIDTITPDVSKILPNKQPFQTKEQNMDEWQKDMDVHWGDINQSFGFKKQAQTAEEYEPTALENYYRRRAGLPTHRKTADTEEKNRLAAEEKGWKYTAPAVPRTQAIDDPKKSIIQIIKAKGKDGQEKELLLTGTSKNIRPEIKERVDQIDRGELVLDPKRGFVQGTSPDAKINIRAREAAKDKTRKDADTLMRSEELKKKLIVGKGKPSKATKKATPEQRKEIMERLSIALDTVKVDQSPEASKERKMLLERVKSKLTGKK